MSKIGFINDVTRGIRKVLSDSKETQKDSIVINSGNTEIEPLLKRAFIFLEDGDWAIADQYCERVLDLVPENAKAYLGKLMAELHVRRKEDLANCEQSFANNNNYQKVIRFGDDSLVEELNGYIAHIIYYLF